MRWDKNEIVRIGETFIIIHNLIIRMCTLGAFDEEVGAWEDASEIIDELYTEYVGLAEQGAAKQEGNGNGLDGDILSDASAEVERLFIFDSIMASEVLHNSLKRNLAKRFMQGSGEADTQWQRCKKLFYFMDSMKRNPLW